VFFCVFVAGGNDTQSMGGKTQLTEVTNRTKITNTHSQAEFTRAPSDKTANSRWSAIKSNISQKSLARNETDDKSLSCKPQGSAISTAIKHDKREFLRVPSNASQANSHWSDVRSKFSAIFSKPVEEAVSDWVYVGEFLEGKKHGQGVQTHDDGRIYAGEWEEGAMHGWGVLTRKDGSVYRGQFEKGTMQGRGAEIIASSEQDKGFHKDDSTGLFLTFEGRWKDGRRDGPGVAGRCVMVGRVGWVGAIAHI